MTVAKSSHERPPIETKHSQSSQYVLRLNLKEVTCANKLLPRSAWQKPIMHWPSAILNLRKCTGHIGSMNCTGQLPYRKHSTTLQYTLDPPTELAEGGPCSQYYNKIHICYCITIIVYVCILLLALYQQSIKILSNVLQLQRVNVCISIFVMHESWLG